MAALAHEHPRAEAERAWSAITRGDASGGRGRAEAFNSLRYERSNEGASRKGTFLRTWRPSLKSADADWLYDRDNVVARTRDLERNDVVAASAIARRINSAVGLGWRFTSKPDFRALGITFEQARTLGRAIDAAWRSFSAGALFQADAERQLTFGQMLRLGAAHIVRDGEMLGLVEWAEGELTPFKTRLRIVDPDRLSNPYGEPVTPYLAGGIERNAHGVRTRYWIREAHPSDLISTGFNANIWRPWDVYSTPLGRPQVIHAFDKLRAGQSRGVSRFVSALKSFRALSKFADATLEAATLDALFLGFVKSNAGLKAISESLSLDDIEKFAGERNDHYDDNPISIDGVQLPVLGLDDEIDLKTAARNNTGFDAFVRAIMRMIAASLGVTYEELSMDFSQTNYSSARAAFLIAWNETLALRGLIEAQIARPFFIAWLEEWWDQGHANDNLPAGAPDFYAAIDAYAAGTWTGPGRGAIDPVKEVLAAAARMEAGITTLEDEVAAYDGGSWEEKIETTAEIERYRLERGLPSEVAAVDQAAQDTKSPFKQAPTPPPADVGEAEEGKAGARMSRRLGTALDRCAAMAMDAAYDASMDAPVTEKAA